jgi:tetratricopeptide (TPR) repeat protein
LADASLAIEDSLGEIEHLKNAIRYEPTNVKLICRLSNRLIESGELQQARTYCDQARRLDPLDEEVKALVARVLQF